MSAFLCLIKTRKSSIYYIIWWINRLDKFDQLDQGNHLLSIVSSTRHNIWKSCKLFNVREKAIKEKESKKKEGKKIDRKSTWKLLGYPEQRRCFALIWFSSYLSLSLQWRIKPKCPPFIWIRLDKAFICQYNISTAVPLKKYTTCSKPSVLQQGPINGALCPPVVTILKWRCS